MVVGEVEALVAMNLSESEFIPDAEVEEQVLWIQKSKRQALFVTNDSIKGAANVLHLGSQQSTSLRGSSGEAHGGHREQKYCQ